ncbi:MAG: hypothetical protein AAF799_04385 [Myxococcota bacterium]
MTAPETPSNTRHWGLRAAGTGLLACGLGTLLGTSRYVALPGALGLDWSQMPLAIAIFAAFAGISVGLCVGGSTLLAARRGAGPLGLMLAGAVGGFLSGLGPGVLGIAGFGSLHAPYAGTANILSSSLVGAITFVALWSPQLFPNRGGISPLRHLGHASIASIVSLGAFGMMGWTLAQGFDLVPRFDQIEATARAIGLLPFSMITGGLLGAIGGAAIGAACALVGRLRR